MPTTDALLKVTIVPRTNAALGFAQYTPTERYLLSKQAVSYNLRGIKVMNLKYKDVYLYV